MAIAVGQFTIIDFTDVNISKTAPTRPILDQLWLDSSVVPNQLKRWTGTKWVVVNDTKDLEKDIKDADDKAQGVLDTVNELKDGSTETSIYSIIKQTKTVDGKPYFARTAEIETTIDNWTAKFEELSVGATNLFTMDSYSDYGSGTITKKDYTLTVSGKNTGIKIDNSIYEPAAEHVLSFKFKKISGTVKSIGFHTGVMTKQTMYVDGNEVSLSASGNFPNDTKEHQVVVYFTAKSGVLSDWDYIQPNRNDSYAYDYKAELYDIKLEKGNIATDWSPSPSELYTGITKIDKDGVTVGREGETIETNLGYDGLKVFDGATEIASFTGSGANIKNLDATYISGDVINIMSSSMTFNIGSVSGYYADFAEVLGAIGNRKYLADGVTLTINIRSVLTETIRIEGFSGGGSIELNIYSRVNGNIETISNSCAIRVFGRNTTHVVSGSGWTIISSADSYTYFNKLNVDSKNTSSGKGITSQRGSNVYVESCDFVNVQDALYALSGGSIMSQDNKGNPTRHGALASSGPIRMRGTIPDGTTYGFVENVGTIPRTSSAFQPPATTTFNETRTFNQTDIYTYSVQYGARSTHYGKAAAQNRWDTSMTQMKGRISFGSSVYSFISGRNSGTSPTVKIRLRRQNSSHGASTSVAPTPEWSGAPSFGGATRGNFTPWVTIPYTLFTSSGYTFSFYNGTTGSSYAIWDRAEIQITRRVTQ